MKVRPPASVSSSEAELPYEGPLPIRKMEFETPPNQIGLMRRDSQPNLAPAANIRPSANRRDKKEHPPATPPHPRRFQMNPNESPSPQRRASNASLLQDNRPIQGEQRANMTFPSSYSPQPDSNQASSSSRSQRNSRQGVDSEKGTRRKKQAQRTQSMIEDDENNYHSDTPPRDAEPDTNLAVISSPHDSEETLSPRSSLPYPVVAASSPAPLSESDSPVKKTPSSRRRTTTKLTRGHRAHPYDVKKAGGTPSPEPEPAVLPKDELGSPNRRYIFAPTPDLSRALDTSSFPDGIPKLQIGRPSISGSSRMIMHDPIETPEEEYPPTRVEETPLFTRTRFGTEIRSAMRGKFSDTGDGPWR
jgi:hypothetical protein